MSTEPTTDLDLTVLKALDFEPSCDSRWHETYGYPAEAATHVGRFTTPCCGTRVMRLLGPTCIERLARGRASGATMICLFCPTGHVPHAAVTLDPL